MRKAADEYAAMLHGISYDEWNLVKHIVNTSFENKSRELQSKLKFSTKEHHSSTI